MMLFMRMLVVRFLRIYLSVVSYWLEMILPDRAYAFFSHTHKAQKENMRLLDKILAERVSLFDYELIVGDEGKRLLAFGRFAGRAGLVDFLSGLGRSMDPKSFYVFGFESIYGLPRF
ncbi:hypothetical protein E3N88_44492 [Mikania micrantha]|uniref:Uncharacterized protein n=1 Tax=Mikania micrantha TaxID=192012 RepID=A0A5N6LBV5_9ASTR|nr:hypothetical protein E3N88_44492 [Mikania micrantha]